MWRPMAKYSIALILSADDVHKLAALESAEEDRGKVECNLMEGFKVKVIDIHYEQDEIGANSSTWRGTGLVSLNGLLRAYLMITSGGDSGAVADYFGSSV